MAPSDDSRPTPDDKHANLRRPFSVSRRPIMVGLGGLEPPTSRLSSARSNQLSYKPVTEDGGPTTDDRPNAVVRPQPSGVR